MAPRLTLTSLQAHPELTSRVLNPSPPVLGFVAASAGCLKQVLESRQQKALANGVDGVHF